MTSTARNRQPLPVNAQEQYVRVTNPRGIMYTIVDTNASLTLDQMYILTLSKRIYMKDEDKVKLSLKQLLIAHDGNCFYLNPHHTRYINIHIPSQSLSDSPPRLKLCS